jgi:hypothetical protein
MDQLIFIEHGTITATDSEICLEQQGLPISGGPVWPGGCTTGFYSDFSDGYSSLAYSVGSSSFWGKSDLNLSCNVPPKTGSLGKEVSETFPKK